MRAIKLSILIILVFVTAGCAGIPEKILYFSKDDSEKKMYYVSQDNPSFIMAIPGTSWQVRFVTSNHIVLGLPKKMVNIFEYSDGLLVKRFFKPGSSEEKALEEYYRLESAHHLSQHPDWKGEIVSRNVAGVNMPNLLWKVAGPTGKIVTLTTSRNKHLISVSWQNVDPPLEGEQQVVEILGSLRFIPPEEAEKIIKAKFN